jgi:hypothetical protein
VPTEFTAIVQKAEPGGELACRALDHRFEENGVAIERGVISYYAIGALPKARTIRAWIAITEIDDSRETGVLIACLVGLKPGVGTASSTNKESAGPMFGAREEYWRIFNKSHLGRAVRQWRNHPLRDVHFRKERLQRLGREVRVHHHA